MAKDARMVAWFLGLEHPVTAAQVAARAGYTVRNARRKLRALHGGGLAEPAGYEGKRFLWRPCAR